MADRRKLLEGIAKKLPVLLGGAVAVSSVHAMPPATVSNASSVASPAVSASSTTAPKLILRQAQTGEDVRLVASHDSHSSHSSHASHASHSSHASRAI
jgi:hypothetical protein